MVREAVACNPRGIGQAIIVSPTVVCGPPAAGKTTRAGEIAARSGGEVIDFDVIARQLGSPDEHDHPEGVKAAVEAVVAAAHGTRRPADEPPAVGTKFAPVQPMPV